MKETTTDGLFFDEKQSIQTIKMAIATSKKALMDEGLLLILWGAAMSVSNFWNYYEKAVLTAWWMRNLMHVVQFGTGILVVGFTIYFIFFRRKKVTSFGAISTRYVWIGVILAHNINIIITKRILDDINFVLLQPLQMVLIGFALFVTGGIYRYYILVGAGVVMWISAAICANFDLNIQFLIRSFAEVICFVLPGILMFTARKRILAHV